MESLFVAVDFSLGAVWGERMEDQCEKLDEHPTPLSKQQLVQLIRSLILVGQVLTLLIYVCRSENRIFSASKVMNDCCSVRFSLCCIFSRAKSPEWWRQTSGVFRKTYSWRKRMFTGPYRTPGSAPTGTLTATERPILTCWHSKYVRKHPST